jgi:cytochrome P450
VLDWAREHSLALAALAREFLGNPARRADWRQFYQAFQGVPPVPLGDDEWIVTGWDDVRAVMCAESAELTAVYPSTGIPDVNQMFLGMLPHESGAEHRRLRGLTKAALASSAVAPFDMAIRRELEDLLYPASFASEGCDIHETIGVTVPERLTCLLLDVAPEAQNSVIEWSHALYNEIGRYDQSPEEIQEAAEAYAAFRDYVLRRASDHQGEVIGGVGTRLCAAHANNDLDDDQLVSYFALFLLTGQDTITYALTNAVCFLGSSPDVFDRLKRRTELAGRAFGEAMRLWGPIRLCVRSMTAPLVTSGVSIDSGARVFALLHAANRDPKRLKQPDEFRWDRSSPESMAFGAGPHGCLGGAVGELVGRLLFESLCQRCADLRVTPTLGGARFVPSLPILGFDEVRLFATPAA